MKMTISELKNILLAAGIDLDGRNGQGDAAKLLSVPTYQVWKAKKQGEVTAQVAEAAAGLASAIKSGDLTPSKFVTAEQVASLTAAGSDADKSDEEIIADQRAVFAGMRRFAELVCLGRLRLLSITGPGGIGKTYPVLQMLRAKKEEGKLKGFTRIAGAISTVKLFEALHECSEPGYVLVLDDCDVKDQESLNLLKSALDSTDQTVSYSKASQVLEAAGVPNSFKFEGSVIMISNLPLGERANKSPHFDAVASRAVVLDMGITSARAMALRVAYMVEEEDMLAQQFAKVGGFALEMYDQAKHEISELVKRHSGRFRSLTLREAAKIADIYLAVDCDIQECTDLVLLSLR